ncbi:MAG: ATP-binding protein [Bacteroidetes bacterium]|nr:ATP-binding protein [Bacteroidota bacterium]
MEIRKSQRKRAKMKMALAGPAGSGKTYSALLIAHGMCNDWSKVTVIDTENHSADLYSHLGDYNVLALDAPFTPERYIKAIELCEKSGSEVIIIDSISNEWECILDIHSNLTGNTFVNWAKLNPRHRAFVQKILQSRTHIIATMRSKQNYVLTEKNNKMVPEKVGMKSISRDGIDYEFTTVLNIDIKHNAVSSKDRTGLFVDKPCFKITKETGELITKWCNQGTSLDEVVEIIAQAQNIDELRQIHASYPDFRTEINSLLIKRKEALKPELQPTV